MKRFNGRGIFIIEFEVTRMITNLSILLLIEKNGKNKQGCDHLIFMIESWRYQIKD